MIKDKNMNILLIGSGGREHAIVKALKKSPMCGRIYALPGNGGIAEDAECVPISATDIEGIVGFAKTHRFVTQTVKAHNRRAV